MNTFSAEIKAFAPAGNLQWLPVIAKQELVAKSGERAEMTFEYMRGLRDSLRKYYADLAELGIMYRRPVIIEHMISDFADDLQHTTAPTGRRSGDILDAEIRMYDATTLSADGPAARWTLFLKVDWRDHAFAAILDKTLEHVSIHTLPTYTDPQTDITYEPFILELSETIKPMVKDFPVFSTVDNEVLKRVGLRLADDPKRPEVKMTPEEIKQLFDQSFETAMLPIVERMNALEAMVAEKKPAEGEGDGDGVEAGDVPAVVPAVAPAVVPAAPVAPLAVAASDNQSAVLAELAKIGSRLTAIEGVQVAASKVRTTAVSMYGAGTGFKAGDPTKLSEEAAWAKAEAELGKGADIRAIARRARQLSA